MKFGFTAMNVGNLAVPEFGPLATLSEELGYESLWTAEHIVLPDLPASETPRPGNMPFIDSIAFMSYLAAVTKTIKLATGVLLLPQHEPLLMAKQVASVDVLSKGRFILGIGVGGVAKEAEAIGAPMSERGSRANEYLEAMIAMWTQEHPAYSGRHVNFDGINSYPRPVQQPHPPIHIGGRSDGALRRLVRYSAGWYGFAMTTDSTREAVASIAEASKKYGSQRRPGLGEIEITVNPRDNIITPDVVKAYADLGVHRMLLRLPTDKDMGAVEQFIRDNAPARLAG